MAYRSVAFIISMKEISPHFNDILQVIKDGCPSDVTYTVYLVTTEDISPNTYENVVIVKDEGTGSCDSYNLGVKESKEDYIVTLTGYTVPNADIFNIMDFIDSLKDGVCTLAGPGCPHTPSYTPRVPILRWPCFSRKFMEENLNGVMFNECFYHHFVDNWLSSWLNLTGRECVTAPIGINSLPHSTDHSKDEYDESIFKKLISSFEDCKDYNNKVDA